MNRVLVLAGNYREAEQLTRELCITNWEYVYSIGTLQKTKGRILIKTGEFWQREDYLAITESILYGNFRVVDIPLHVLVDSFPAV